MLYQLRTGDVILCENKPLNKTNAYLIVYDTDKMGLDYGVLDVARLLDFMEMTLKR